MRGDNGTENGIVAQMQEFLSGNNINTFFYGKSTGNQRIEMFWNFLRKECVQYWIDSLGTLRDTDIFDLCMMYMVENSLQPPENLEEALELYIFLRISIHRDI